MKYILTALCLILVSIGVKAEPVVLSGDAINVDNKLQRFSVFLYGIDAPDPGQVCKRPDGKEWPCGEVAKNYLRRMMTSPNMRCEKIGLDAFNRTFSKCFLGEKDLAQEMVKAGYAVAYRIQTTDYVNDEDYARNRKLGMWNGTFTNPWVWRKEKGKRRQ